jgi:GT2 family glycosyltransferase
VTDLSVSDSSVPDAPATDTPATHMSVPDLSMPNLSITGAGGPPQGDYDADVLILALDRPDETLAAIASALAQTGVSRHVVVVDQGSCTSTLARLTAAVAERAEVKLVSAGSNLGVAAGRNLAASLGHGRVIVALDNDAEFADATTLARAVAALDAAPDVGAVGFRIVTYANGAEDLSSWGYPPALLARAGQAFDAATFVGAGHAIRRSAWEAAGGYDPTLFFCWEELDFCLRAIAAGWRVQYRGDLVVRHKVSAERRVNWSGERWFYFVRNRIYIARKWRAGWIELVPRIAAYLVKGLRNRLLWQTLRGVVAAARMPVSPRPVPAAMRRYLARNDLAHRGSWRTRLRREVLAGLPGGRGGVAKIALPAL